MEKIAFTIREQIEELKELENENDDVKRSQRIKKIILLLEEIKQRDLTVEQEERLATIVEKQLCYIRDGKTGGVAMHKAKNKITTFARKELNLVPKSFYTGVGIMFGMTMGLALGLSLSDGTAFMSVGLAIGMACGIGLGAYLDNKAKKEGRQLTVE